MCLVSFIGDHYSQRLPEQHTWVTNTTFPAVSREEFEQLRRDVEEMKLLLQKAKQYDIDHGEPDCEMESKVELLRRIAELVGVDLEDVLG